MTEHVLDDWIGAALRGDHRGFAFEADGAARYLPAVSPFGAVSGDLRALDGLPFDDVVLPTPGPIEAPAGWVKAVEFAADQMVDSDVRSLPDEPYGVPLTQDDVPEMLALVELTHPGPFAANTIALGGYVGVREEGRLVAMAGRRAAPPGWTEISAVCTHPDFRGRGYAGRLMLEVLRGVRADGRRGFLTVLDGNPARRLYETLGFVQRKRFTITRLTRS
jgi:ribosomal protein S18 acetylase RimI-like enzyme